MTYAQLIKKSLIRWMDSASLYGAAISYYTIFSIGPLVTVIIWFLGIFLEEEAIQGQVYELLSNMVNPTVAKQIQDLVIHAGQESQKGVWTTIIGVIITVFSALRIVILMKESLDQIWEVHQERQKVSLIKKYIVSLAGIFGIGIILLVSGLMNAIVFVFGSGVFHLLPFTKTVIYVANHLIVFVSVTLFISAMFKYLPNIRLPWKAVIPGALFTSSIFFLGKILFSWYMSTQMLDSMYGAAASLVIFMMWIYFSSHVIFLGAEFTQIYARDKRFVTRK